MIRSALIAAAIAIAPASAFAADVNLRSIIHDASGQPAQDCDQVNRQTAPPPSCTHYATVTIGYLMAAALDRIEPGESASDIVAHGHLVEKIRNALAMLDPKTMGVMSIDDRDIQYVKDELSKMGLPASEIAQAYDLLSPPIK
jgi:hypothetical protein